MKKTLFGCAALRRMLTYKQKDSRGSNPGIIDILGADNGTRTRDPQLGKLMLYQLSYVRAYLASPYNDMLHIIIFF